MKNLLLTCLLVITSYFASAQCNSVCSPCTKPIVDSVAVNGTTLSASWNNDWAWGYGCSKSVSILVDGVEYANNGLFYPGIQLYDNWASGGPIPGYSAIPGDTICVVVRNYCSSPYTCDLANYVDSDPYCITAPSAPTPVPVVDCLCPNGQYKVKKGNSYKCTTQAGCLKFVNRGWISDCNCQ